MASNFPTAQPAAKTDYDNADEITSADQNAQGEDINALGAKLGHGTDDNTPALNKILRGTAAGKSEWDIDLKDEDTMTSDSATAVPTQQSVKAYVDTHASDTSTHGVTTVAGISETQILSNKTLKNPTITDANGYNVFTFNTGADVTRTDYIRLNNSNGGIPFFEALGTSTNIDIRLCPKGTGLLYQGNVPVATTTTTQTLTNKTLSTSCALDAGADENFTYYGLSRQAVINGNFDIWQRGTTLTWSVFTRLADKWELWNTADGGTLPTLVYSRQALTAGDLPGSFYYFRLAPNGAGTSLGNATISQTLQKIEYGTRFLCGNGKKVTLSFYARASVASKKLGVNLFQDYGTGGSPTSQEIITGTAFTLTSSWVKYTYTFTTNTLAEKTFGTANNDWLGVNFANAWGSTTGTAWGLGVAETYGGNGTIDIAQVQLCAGDVALPFQPKSFEEELRACMRYYYRLTATDSYARFAQGVGNGTTTVNAIFPLPPMRRIPDVPTYGGNLGTWDGAAIIAVTAINSGAPSLQSYMANVIVASGITAGKLYQIIANNSATAYIEFNAEL